jgi:hypothetical protein
VPLRAVSSRVVECTVARLFCSVLFCSLEWRLSLQSWNFHGKRRRRKPLL